MNPGVLGFPGRAAATAAAIVVLAAEYAAGTTGGTNATGAWTTRPINTKRVDTAGICSLVGNEFTLPAGRYQVRAASAHVQCDNVQIRLWNVTTGAVLLLGICDRVTTAAALGTIVTLDGVFDLAAASALRLEYQSSTQYASGGLGLPTSWGTEVYAQIALEKVA